MDPIQNPTSLPSIKQLFKESWNTFVKSILPLFILNIVTFLFIFIITIIIGIIALISANYLGVFKALSNIKDLSNILPLINPQTFFLTTIIFISYSLIVSVFMSLVQISSVLIVSDSSQTTASFSASFKKSFSLFFPVLLIGIVTTFITVGSFFLFVLPVFVVTYFLMYVGFEVVISGKKGKEALRGSVQIISQHFGEIIIRSIIYLVLYLFIAVFIPNLVTKIDQETGALFGFFYFFVNCLVGWFSLSFSVTLYKQVKAVTDFNKKTNLTWIVIVSIIGWLIFGLAMYFLVGLGYDQYQKGRLDTLWKNIITDSSQKKNNTPTTYAPSPCGVSIPVPDGKIIEKEKENRWYYQEFLLTPAGFVVLDQDIYPIKQVLVSGVFIKDEPIVAKDGQYNLTSPGVYVYCADNVKNYSLDEYISLAKTNKTKTIKQISTFNWGEIKAEYMTIERKEGDKNYLTPVYLTQSKDGSKLIYIVLWGLDDKEPNAKTIKTKTDNILANLKYRSSKDKIDQLIINLPTPTQKPVSTTYTQPACNRYTIREGEFASNKCYTQKDYDDLTYYAQRFDSAVFSNNAAISSMRITCNGSEFFKSSCERDQAKKKQAEEDMNKYRGIIQGIIAKGW